MEDLRFLWEPYLLYGQRRHLKKNNILFRQGEKGSGFYYLHEGQVSIKILTSQGEERVIDYVPTGTLLGEQGLKGDPYFTAAVVTEPSILYFFSNDAFGQISREHDQAASIFLHSLIQKQRMLAETITMLNRPIEQQMAHFVLKLLRLYSDSAIPINQTSLSRYIGTSRITIYKILQQWKKENIIELSQRSIVVKDKERLKSVISYIF